MITVKFDKKYNTPHQLFVKEHNVREKTDDRPRELTLFVCNIPVYCTKVKHYNKYVFAFL